MSAKTAAICAPASGVLLQERGTFQMTFVDSAKRTERAESQIALYGGKEDVAAEACLPECW